MSHSSAVVNPIVDDFLKGRCTDPEARSALVEHYNRELMKTRVGRTVPAWFAEAASRVASEYSTRINELKNGVPLDKFRYNAE